MEESVAFGGGGLGIEFEGGGGAGTEVGEGDGEAGGLEAGDIIEIDPSKDLERL